MKLFTMGNSELMSVSRIEAEGSGLAISARIMDTIPVNVVLTGSEIRRVIPLLSGKVILTVIRMLFSK